MALTKIDDRGLKTPIDLLDNEKIRFGTGNDLELYHDGTRSWVRDSGSGNLIIDTDGSEIDINSGGNAEYMARFIKDGSVELYHNNAKKFETTSAGASVSGTITSEHTSGNIGYTLHANGNSLGSQIKLHNDHGVAYVGQAGDTSGNLLIWNESNTDIKIATNNSERLRIDSSGKVGIGITPTARLHVNGISSEHIITARSADSNGNCVVNILSEGTTGTSRILFSDTAANDGIISYSHNDRALIFGAAGTSENMRIDSSGRVGIGSNSPVASTALFGGTQNCLKVAGSAAPQVRIVSDTANQADLILQAGNSGADAYIANAGSNGDIVFSTHNGTSQGTRLRILDDGGICFNSDTAAANALSDYEEGTFTPTAYKGSTQLSSPTQAIGRYTKIGRIVSINFYIFKAWDGTGVSASGSWTVQDMPFSFVGANSSGYNFIPASYVSMNGTANIAETPRWQVNSTGTSVLSLYASVSSTAWSAGGIEFAGSGTLYV